MKNSLFAGLMIAVAMLTGTGLVSGDDYGPARVIVPAPEGDRFCHLSWPKIVKANDGSLVVAFIAGRKHVNGDGCPAVSVSTDGGKSFTSPYVLKTFDSSMQYQHAANLAMGMAEDGAIVLMAMAFTDDLRNNIYGWRSLDNGQTWEATDTSAIGDSKTGSVFGHVFQVPGKGLAVCGHYRKPSGYGLWIAYSEDDGKTWGPAQRITKEKYYEPTFISTGGRLIGLAGENAAHAYHQYVSDDFGTSWQFQESVIQGNEKSVHPSPFIVSDPTQPNRLYALQSERNESNLISLWQSQSDSLNWERHSLVASCPGIEDFSYPWMTHLEGNDWFVVYYAGEKDGPNSIYGMKITIQPRIAKNELIKPDGDGGN